MRYGKILMPLCLTGAQALAGQVSGGGPSAVKAEEYILSAPDFDALRDRLKKLDPQRHEVPGTGELGEPFVIRDDKGQVIIIRKSPDAEVPAGFE
jgi:hypothetical protein